MPPVDASALALIAAAAAMFMFGGTVKGTLGVGLPLLMVPMLSLLVPAPQAMGLLVMPVLLSNFWQARAGGRVIYTLRRFSPLLVAQFGATVLAIHLTRDFSPKAFNAFLALAVLVGVASMVLRPQAELTPRQQLWAAPAVGIVAGFMGGVSSLTGPVIITYLMALRLKREEFIGSISTIYLVSAVPTYGLMLAYGRFSWVEVGWSCAGLLPMFVGLRIGQAIRHRLSEEVFRRIILALLICLTVVLLVK